MKWTNSVAAFLVAALTVDAKDIKTADGRKARTVVELGVDDDLCIFENDDDQWCFKATPPMVKIGWEWEQNY